MTKKIKQDVIKLCEKFAEKCCLTNLDEYKKRNQNNLDKIKKDIAIGKIGEIGVYYILLEKGIKNINFPDFKIYKKEKKSFDSDLKVGNYNLHIKTQTKKSSLLFEESWMFQKKDPVISNPTNYDFFIGNIYDEDNFELKLVLSKHVKLLKFDKPKLPTLSNKVCVYLKNNLG
jgi:hypothetical protein